MSSLISLHYVDNFTTILRYYTFNFACLDHIYFIFANFIARRQTNVPTGMFHWKCQEDFWFTRSEKGCKHKLKLASLSQHKGKNSLTGSVYTLQILNRSLSFGSAGRRVLSSLDKVMLSASAFSVVFMLNADMKWYPSSHLAPSKRAYKPNSLKCQTISFG